MKAYGKHKPLTQEMVDDLSKMCDQDFMAKWNTSRQYPIRARKRLEIKSFTNQYGAVRHKFENGKEYKWCQKGHWELVENFGRHESRWDGLRGWCKNHCNESARVSKNALNKTPKGKARIRFHNNRRRTSIILWEYLDEKRAMQLYGNRCGYCGTLINHKTVEFDHILPISKGGKTIPENMIPSCVKCNRGVNGKKAKDVLVWLHSKFGVDIGDCIYEDICGKQNIIAYETKERLESIKS